MARNVKKGRGKTGKRVKDFQNGSAANDYDVAVDGDDGPGEGHNSKFEPNGKALTDFLAVLDDEDAEIAAIMKAARLKAQGPRAAITKAKKRMTKDGYPTKELETLMRKHRIKRKLANIAEGLNADQVEVFQSFEQALGDYASTPLGNAAVQAAEAANIH